MKRSIVACVSLNALSVPGTIPGLVSSLGKWWRTLTNKYAKILYQINSVQNWRVKTHVVKII